LTQEGKEYKTVLTMMKAVYWRYEYIFAFYDKIPQPNTKYNIFNRIQYNIMPLIISNV